MSDVAVLSFLLVFIPKDAIVPLADFWALDGVFDASAHLKASTS